MSDNSMNFELKLKTDEFDKSIVRKLLDFFLYLNYHLLF